MSEQTLYDQAKQCVKQKDYLRAKELFEQALEEGCFEAYNGLGYLYYCGLGVEKSLKEALGYYKKGAKAGELRCIKKMATFSRRGVGNIEADIEKAAYYSEKAAEKGDVYAMYDTAFNYEKGYGFPKDSKKTLYWLEKAAENGFAAAFTELGNIYSAGIWVEKDLKRSIDYYQKGAELGGNKAKLALAKLYEDGKVLGKDLDKARNLYQQVFDNLREKAVVDDSPNAQLTLGMLYFRGLPLLEIPVDYHQAMSWFKKAAKKGDSTAENNMGVMYTYGLGVGQNYKKALEWYIRAAKKKQLAALGNIGESFYYGRGLDQDFAKAADYHSQAANLGWPKSQKTLGEMYLDGKGVEQDYTKAAYWLKKACESDNRLAFSLLGDCYRKGQGVKKDKKRAFELYQDGAEQGDVRSKVLMAQCLIEGWGTSPDDVKAFQILEGICNAEEEYREQLVTVTTYVNKNGNISLCNPLDEENLKHYAKAYFMLALLYNSGSGTKKNGSEAIRLLHIARKLGYDEVRKQTDEGKGMSIDELLDKITKENVNKAVRDTLNCSVEVREVKRRGERYEVVIHHADGTESVVDFKGRNKFFYVLALLTTYEGSSVSGLTTNHFSFMRDDLRKLASEFCINTSSYEDWIDEFIYVEKPEAMNQREIGDDQKTYCYCSFCSDKYSNASTAANKAISKCCTGEELETFRLRKTGRKPAVTTISIAPSQIILPDSLKAYLDRLPTSDKIRNHKPKGVKKIPLKE